MGTIVQRLVRKIRAHSQRGAAMVEFAMILPILGTLFVGIAELGHALKVYTATVAASRDAVRLATRTGAGDSTVINLAKTDMNHIDPVNYLTRTTVTVSGVVSHTVDGETTKKKTVTVCYARPRWINYPLLPIPSTMDICSTATMRMQGV